MRPAFFITIGTSAGGSNALSELVSQFPKDIDAAVLIVMHISRTDIDGFLCHRLQPLTKLPCIIPRADTPIQKGRIYIAPANYHMLISDGIIKTGKGAKENNWRPSIDVLFRSAAANHGERVIGIILTGMLDDGTAGMIAIKSAGGTGIVQAPEEAKHPDMPMSVIEHTEVDYILPISKMGDAIEEVMTGKEIKNIPIPPAIVKEARIAERSAVSLDVVSELGERSLYTCPDCGGGLWQITESGTTRYRCHTGHVYSEATLLAKQSEELENTLWVAMRMIEERRALLLKIADKVIGKGGARLSESYLERAGDLDVHINRLKDILFETNED